MHDAAVPDERNLAELAALLGHGFVDVSLLERAVVHSSWAHDRSPPAPDNERLEFLGDAVLGLLVAERLFHEFDDDEGRLSRARSRLVAREAQAERARRMGLGAWLRLGRGEDASGGRDKDSILAGVFEALVGALYLDGGLEAARGFVEREMAGDMDRRGSDGGVHSPRDPKSRLQERLQRAGAGTPSYPVAGREGLSHEPLWTVEVVLDGEVLGVGTGRSQQAAGMEAARAALARLDDGGGQQEPGPG